MAGASLAQGKAGSIERRITRLFRNATFVLRRIEKVAFEWSSAVYLEDRLGVTPSEMVHTGGNYGQVRGMNRLSGGVDVKMIADCEVKWATGNYGDMFIDAMGMGPDMVVSRIFESNPEIAGLRGITIQAKHLAPCGHAGAIDPTARLVGEHCWSFCFLGARHYSSADSNGKK
jgi:hypothetical protein